ncbi:MAG: alpha-amylase family glycosyl hydrolase [Eubacteriales bacterium]|nr:alpha-amylase family glycosyl hydrolase [Eubacteriales bacterium]
MKAKRILSVVLTLTLVLSCCVAGFTFAPSASAASEYNEYEKMLESIKPENNYGLTDTVNEGKIIQGWNWSYRNITDNLKTIAEQGFTTIQVSPPNEIKMPTKGVKVCEPAVNGVAPNGWWMFYQPAGFQLNESEDNALGTKAEFVKMCEEANKLGVKIIVDAVINHMGTDDDHTGLYTNTSEDPMDHVNPRAWEFEKEIIEAKAFHSPWVDMTYKENYWDGYNDKDIEEDLTQHCTSGLPDLDTSTKVVQDAIYDYLEELILAGADGFRFDAAKHIETKYDTYFASDFWDNTLIKLRENYPDEEIYTYGEILNKCGDGRPFSEYTWMMDVTDSASYWGIKDAVQKNGNGGNSIPYYPSTNFTKENVIQWNESHDTYIDGGTSSLTIQQRNKIWALTAARQTITGVYFARPDDRTGANRAAIENICSGIYLGDLNLTSWTRPEVKAVNQFDNYFGDAAEYNSVQNKVTVIERGGKGATLVNLNGTTATVDLKANTLADGTYIESITGNKFTVSGGRIKGSIGSTGIACIYYADDSQPDVPDVPGTDDIWSIDVSNGQYPTMDGYNTIVYSAKSNWNEAYIYAWSGDGNTANIMELWPGRQMKFALVNDYGENQFVGYIPAEYDHYIINAGQGGEQTVDLDVSTSMGMYMSTKNTEGKWTIGTWDPPFYDVTPVTTAPVVTDPVGTDPIVSNPVVSDPIVTDPIGTDPIGTDNLLGDVNGDAKVNVKDATLIQKAVANFDVPEFVEDLADANGDTNIDVKDATAIQKWVAGLITDSPIGKPVA